VCVCVCVCVFGEVSGEESKCGGRSEEESVWYLCGWIEEMRKVHL